MRAIKELMLCFGNSKGCLRSEKFMPQRSHEKWTQEEEAELLTRYRDGAFPSQICMQLGRSELAIRTRLARHGLLPPITEQDLEHFRSIREKMTQDPGGDQALPDSAISPQCPEPIELATEGVTSIAVPIDIQQAFHRFHFVYALVNSSSLVYIGYSRDVWQRVQQHNRNVGAKATQGRGPWFPFSISCVAAEIDARVLERKLQRGFRSFTRANSTSLKEVLAQIGVAFDVDRIQLAR